jgi:hypothetical protein
MPGNILRKESSAELVEQDDDDHDYDTKNNYRTRRKLDLGLGFFHVTHQSALS